MTRYRRLLTYVVPYRRRLAAAILCSVAVSATTGYAALLVKPILDEVFLARDTSRLVLFPFWSCCCTSREASSFTARHT